MKTVDITDVLFPQANLTLEEQVRWRLWGLASGEANEIIEGLPLFEGPLFKYDYTDKIYMWLLEKECLKYDEERGF
ncbi:MAG: hypothetical protein WCI72_01625 [archaeon]